MEQVTVIAKDEFFIQSERSVLAVLQENGIAIPASCSGRGRCGKCRIIVTDGDAPITAEDRKAFRQEELDEGYRLACLLVPSAGVTIRIPESTRRAEEQYHAVDAFAGNGEKDIEGDTGGFEGTGAAVDIGTTTLAFAKVDLATGAVRKSVSAMNPQRQHGADVLSRIAAADGLGGKMQEEILTALAQGLERLYRSEERPERIAVAGNTVMLHLLRGYDVSELGRIPFRPVTLEEENLTAGELFGAYLPAWLPKEIPVCLLPGISAFVGADITAGLYACDFFTRKDRAFLLDLGTNGEMALLSDGVLYTASAAAGPAFEGGNISCGIGSVEGAVSDVRLYRDADGAMVSKTTAIGNQKPAGLCGTGLISLISELKREEAMDETGLLNEEYFESGFPFAGEGNETLYLTQKDIRELQLAKGAIRAGISILLARAGLRADEVDKVYLAGGFGFYLDTGAAIGICLLPSVWSGRITAAGNSCIGGLVRYLTAKNGEFEALFNREQIQEINLAEQPDFYDKYTEAMAFEEEMLD